MQQQLTLEGCPLCCPLSRDRVVPHLPSLLGEAATLSGAQHNTKQRHTHRTRLEALLGLWIAMGEMYDLFTPFARPLMVVVRAARVPCQLNRRGGGGEGVNNSILVRIRKHWEVRGHVEAGYKNELNISFVPLATGKRAPRLIVIVNVFVERRLEPSIDIFNIRWVLR